jgi:V8-like Glu-specific endopeptidase
MALGGKGVGVALVVASATVAGCASSSTNEAVDLDTIKAEILAPQRSAAAYTEAVTVQVNNAAADFCSGVLVAPRVVLTAAHCVAFNPDSDGAGPRGTWTVTAPFAVGGAQTRTASSGEPYDPAFYTLSVVNYDSTDSALHDLGLLYLDAAMTGVTLPSLDATQYPIGATTPAVSAVGRASVSAGAGLVLSKQVNLSATSAGVYPNDNKTARVTDGGDSGGPLFLEGTHTLVGTETRFDPAGSLDYWARLDGAVYTFIQSAIALHGGATNDPVVDFEVMVAASLCGRVAGCCVASTPAYLLEPNKCRAFYRELGFEATARGLPSSSHANLTIDATKRGACLTAIGNTAACTAASAQVKTNLANCVGAVVGSVGAGGACTSSAECAGNSACSFAASGAGTCQPLAAIGASCEVAYKGGSVDERYDLAQELCSKRAGGTPAASCDGYDFVGSAYKAEATWTCKAAGANGTACGTSAECTSGICAPFGSPGALTCVANTSFVTSAVCTAFQ